MRRRPSKRGTQRTLNVHDIAVVELTSVRPGRVEVTLASPTHKVVLHLCDDLVETAAGILWQVVAAREKHVAAMRQALQQPSGGARA